MRASIFVAEIDKNKNYSQKGYHQAEKGESDRWKLLPGEDVSFLQTQIAYGRKNVRQRNRRQNSLQNNFFWQRLERLTRLLTFNSKTTPKQSVAMEMK